MTKSSAAPHHQTELSFFPEEDQIINLDFFDMKNAAFQRVPLYRAVGAGGVGRSGGAGRPCPPPPILADHITLSQPKGTDYALPLEFSDLPEALLYITATSYPKKAWQGSFSPASFRANKIKQPPHMRVVLVFSGNRQDMHVSDTNYVRHFQCLKITQVGIYKVWSCLA